MSKKKNTETEPNSDNGKAPWILMALRISRNTTDQEEPMAFVRTPQGDRWVPASEAKGKVNVFEQLPECKKKELARRVLDMIREERESGKRDDPQRAKEAPNR